MPPPLPPPPPPPPSSSEKQVLFEEEGVQLTTKGVKLPPRKFASAKEAPAAAQKAETAVQLQSFSDRVAMDDETFFILVRSVEDVKRAFQAWGTERIASVVDKLLQDKRHTALEKQRVKLMWTNEIDKAFEKEIVINALLPRLFFGESSDNDLCMDLFRVKSNLMNVATTVRAEEKKEKDIDVAVDEYLELNQVLARPKKSLTQEVPDRLEATLTQYELPPGVKSAVLALVPTLRKLKVPGIDGTSPVSREKQQAVQKEWNRLFLPLGRAISDPAEEQRVPDDFRRAFERESDLTRIANSAHVQKKRASAEQLLNKIGIDDAPTKSMLENIAPQTAVETRKRVKALRNVSDQSSARDKAFVEIGENLTPLELNVLQLIVDKDVFQALTNALADVKAAGRERQLYFALGTKEGGSLKVKVGFPEGLTPERPDASFFDGKTCNGKTYDAMIDEINIEETRKREEEARKVREKELRTEIDEIVEPTTNEKERIASAIVLVRQSQLPPEQSEPVIGHLERTLAALETKMRKELCDMLQRQFSSSGDNSQLLAMIAAALGDTQTTFSEDDTIDALRQKICPETPADATDDDERSSAATPVKDTADAIVAQVAAEERVEEAEDAVASVESRAQATANSQSKLKRMAGVALLGGGGAIATRENVERFAQKLDAVKAEKANTDAALGDARSKLAQAREAAEEARKNAEQTIAELRERAAVAEQKVETVATERVEQYRGGCNIDVDVLQRMFDSGDVNNLHVSVNTYLLLFLPDDEKQNIPERLVDKIDLLSGLCKRERERSKEIPLQPDNVSLFADELQKWYTPAFDSSCATAVEKGDLPEIMERIRTLQKKMSPAEFPVEPGPLSLEDAKNELKDMCTTMNDMLAQPRDKVVERLDQTLRDKRPFWKQVTRGDIAAGVGVGLAAALGASAVAPTTEGMGTAAAEDVASLRSGTEPVALAARPIAADLAITAPNAVKALRKLDELARGEKSGVLTPEMLVADLRFMNDEVVDKISQLEVVRKDIDAQIARVTDKDYISADAVAAGTDLNNLFNARAKVNDSLESVRFVAEKLQGVLSDATQSSNSWGGWIQSIVERGTGAAPGSLSVIREQLPNAMFAAQTALLAASKLHPATGVAAHAATTAATHSMVLRSMVGQSLA